MKMLFRCTLLTAGLMLCDANSAPLSAQALEQRLLAEDPQTLAADARAEGDPGRGAILFYQRYLTCRQCHTPTGGAEDLGPDLSQPNPPTTDVHVVDSVLRPSQQIRRGFEAVTVVTKRGQTFTGLLAEQTADQWVLRDAARIGQQISLSTADVEQAVTSEKSLMPAGLVNQLASRQQFLDLVRYLLEIKQYGPQRARQLEPAPTLYDSEELPEYEQHIDHAGLIAELDEASFERGAAVYNRLCINCHGTHDRAGSLPTSLRFAQDKFKNGSDPYTLYQTLTRGFGRMVPQKWMVPQQKYDVIHYIREAYLKRHNPSQYFAVDAAYLASLPQGDARGPEPDTIFAWEQMDYGPNLIATYEIGSDATNFAYKGNAIRLDAGPGGVSRGAVWIVYDYDTLRVAAAWSGSGFIDWNSINFNGRHAIHPRLVGRVLLANPTGPGWANPTDESFSDSRLRGRDQRAYGPLPKDWAHYKGMYYHGNQIVISYRVGQADILETPSLLEAGVRPIIARTFRVGPRTEELVLQVAHRPGSRLQRLRSSAAVRFGDAMPHTREAAPTPADSSHSPPLVLSLSGDTDGLSWQVTNDADLRLRIAAGARPLRFQLICSPAEDAAQQISLAAALAARTQPASLPALTRGGPPRWPERLTTSARIGSDSGPFAVDVLTLPSNNPWFCRLRLTGFDFFPQGDRAAVCTWDGSVWLVRGLSQLDHAADATVPLSWQRIASGLFQPLGLKIVKNRIYVSCRDQICVLHDLNGDDEIDFYANFNNDHQVTEHFHEFAMGLQSDEAGNFYYAKSARHALPALVPHHGTLLRVAADGQQTDILASGFRAANGVCLNPDGTFVVTDQEGHWNPKNRINWVRPGGFYGNMFGYHDVRDSSDDAMEPPLCWITNAFDRSPAELLWVSSNKWGPLGGSLLNLSYGYGKIYVVPHQHVGDRVQGGMCELPLAPFPTGLMRARFHPRDGQLYACGMFAWGGSRQQPGGFYRIRYTGREVHLPIELRATQHGLELGFSGALDPQTAHEPTNYAVRIWSLKRSAAYGSEHYDERTLAIASARLMRDGRRVRLEIPEVQPTWCMEIRYQLRSSSGKPVHGVIHNTIHRLR